MSEAALPYHGAAYGHLAVPHAVGAFAVLVVFLVLDTFAVAGLFYCRFQTRGRLFTSDWLVLTALFLYYGYAVGSFLSLWIGGTGYHITEVGSYELVTSAKISLASEFEYAVGMCLLKLSILLLLAQIFATKRFRIAAYCVMALSVAWAIMTILIGFLLCTPFAYNWNTSIKGGHCGNKTSAYSAVSGVEVIIDAMICALPLPMVWNLKAPTPTKISLSILFCLGIFTIIITGVRLNAILTTDFDDFTYTSTNIFVWSEVEWGVATLVTCGPGCKPLLEKVFPTRLVTRRTHGSNSKSGQPGSDSNHTPQGSSTPFGTTGGGNSVTAKLANKLGLSSIASKGASRKDDSQFEQLDDEEIALRPTYNPQTVTHIGADRRSRSGPIVTGDPRVDSKMRNHPIGNISATTELTMRNESDDGSLAKDYGMV